MYLNCNHTSDFLSEGILFESAHSRLNTKFGYEGHPAGRDKPLSGILDCDLFTRDCKLNFSFLMHWLRILFYSCKGTADGSLFSFNFILNQEGTHTKSSLTWHDKSCFALGKEMSKMIWLVLVSSSINELQQPVFSSANLYGTPYKDQWYARILNQMSKYYFYDA